MLFIQKCGGMAHSFHVFPSSSSSSKPLPFLLAVIFCSLNMVVGLDPFTFLFILCCLGGSYQRKFSIPFHRYFTGPCPKECSAFKKEMLFLCPLVL